MKPVLAIWLVFLCAASSGRAADLSAEPSVAYDARSSTILIARAPRTLVPLCYEAPTWWLAAPPLLRCAPRLYLRPDSLDKLNEVKAIDRLVRGPYPEIARFR